MVLVDIWIAMGTIPHLRNVKTDTSEPQQIISLQIKCYKKSFHLMFKRIVHIHNTILKSLLGCKRYQTRCNSDTFIKLVHFLYFQI